MLSLSGSRTGRTPKSRTVPGNQASKKPEDNKDEDGKMHHWSWGWGNVVGVIPSDPNPRVSVPWNEKSRFIHYVDRKGNVTSKLRSESSESPAPKGKSPANVLRRLHADEAETSAAGAKGKGPETKVKSTEAEGKKLETDGKGTKKAKRYIYVDRHGMVSSTQVRLSKPGAGPGFIYRNGEISRPKTAMATEEEEEGDDDDDGDSDDDEASEAT